MHDSNQPLTIDDIEAMSNPVLTLWEDFGGRGDQVLWMLLQRLPMRVNRGDAGFINDEAKSMRLFRVPAGTTIELFEAENGNTGSSWARVTTKRDLVDRVVHSFEIPINDADLTLEYHNRGRSLNGKVSSVIVR